VDARFILVQMRALEATELILLIPAILRAFWTGRTGEGSFFVGACSILIFVGFIIVIFLAHTADYAAGNNGGRMPELQGAINAQAPDKFECIGRRRSAWCTKLNSADADSETPRRLPHGDYVLHRLDVHKRTISYCVKDVSGRVYAEGSVPATRFDLDRDENTAAAVTAAMEATMFSGWIYDHLKPHAAALKVAHPLMLRPLRRRKRRTIALMPIRFATACGAIFCRSAT